MLGFLGISRVSEASSSPAALARSLAVEARGSPGSPALAIDESLARAASRHALELLRDEAKADHRRVRAALFAEGLADAAVLPFAAIGDLDRLEREAIDFARREANGRGMTHLGLAIVGSGERRVLVVLYVRRLVELAPIANKPGASFTVRGRIAGGATGPLAFVTWPAGDVSEVKVARDGSAFRAEVPLSRGNGRYTIELLADAGLGPEVAALWRFELPGGVVPADATPRAQSSGDALAEIAAFRRRHRLTAFASDPRLTRAAAEHAQRICEKRLAVHFFPPGSTPEIRAAREGFKGAVDENIAIAATLGDALFDLEDSPSHRKNLLDSRATSIGIGLVENAGAVCLVELFGIYAEP